MNQKIVQMQPSVSVTLMGKAKEMQKKDSSVISLAGGEPDFDTPAPITMGAIRSLLEGNTHYVVGPGIPELRTAIQKKLLEENGISCNADHILLTPGGKNAIYLAVNAILNPDEEVIVLDPSWVSYEPIIQAAGGKCVKVKLDYQTQYRITKEKLEEAYSERTRLLIINYPNNPTGCILHEDEADILEAFLLEHPEVYLLSDEVYETLVYDGNKSVSMAARARVSERVITVNGFSKSAAMTGWRMGYMVSNEEVFKTAYKLYTHSLSCMSGFLQKGAVHAFACKRETEEMRRIYEQRRNMFFGILNGTKGVHCNLPEGAFYAWVYFDVKGMDSFAMCDYLMENAGVVGMPGSAYGEESVCCMRFSFAAATEDLERAAKNIKAAIEKLG